MKMIRTSITMLVIVVTLFAHGQTFDWVKTIGGTEFEASYSLALDDFGNVYTVGSFQGTADFDPNAGVTNITSQGFSDVFIQKLNPVGDLIWVKTFGGPDDDIGTSIVIDNAGNLIVAGMFTSTVDFDPNGGIVSYTSIGLYDAFVQKLDPNGNLMWVNHMGGTNNDRPGMLTTDAAGNILVTGTFLATVDFDPGPGVLNVTAVGATDVFIQKLSTVGDLVWIKSFGGTDWNNSISMTLDNSENILVVGYFAGVADFDPGAGTFNLAATGAFDAFILKLDPNGDFIWAKRMGASGTNQVIAYSVGVDGANNVYTGGIFWGGPADFDPNIGTVNLTPPGITSTFVQKLDANGDFLWVKSIGGTLENGILSIVVEEIGDVYTTGFFSGTSDFDPNFGVNNITSQGSKDVFIQKMNSAGDPLWTRTFGGPEFEWPRSIRKDVFGNILVTGYFKDTVDFDPGAGVSIIPSEGDFDVFIEKLRPCDVGVDQIETCNSFTWIDGVNYTSSNNSAVYTLNGSLGCDSLLVLDLTIIPVDVSVNVVNSTLVANANGAIYQWLDCNDNYAPIFGAIGQTLVSFQGGSYAVSVTENGCTDTSACITVLSLQENDLSNYVNVFPNPTNGMINLAFDQKQNHVDISVLDLNGRLISDEQFTAIENAIIEIDGASGIYFLEITINNKRGVVKVFKE